MNRVVRSRFVGHRELTAMRVLCGRCLCSIDAREWLFTFTLPPIPVHSIPIPSHSHSQFCNQLPLPWESHGIPIPIGNPIPMVISTLQYRASDGPLALAAAAAAIYALCPKHSAVWADNVQNQRLSNSIILRSS